jgi:AcrR family transcriptional regulator
MVYYYFGSKDGYFTALVEHMFDIARDTFEGILPQGISVREALRRFMLTRLRLQRRTPGIRRPGRTSCRKAGGCPTWKSPAEGFFQEVLKPVFDQAAKTGEIRPDIKPGLVLAVLASVIEVALEKQHVNTSDALLMDRLVEDVTDLVFNGIRSREKGDEAND